MKYYSNFDERGKIHIEEAQEAYDDLAKDNGYASGDDALAAEAAKLGLAQATLSAAQSAYDLALANATANPGDAGFAAALIAAQARSIRRRRLTIAVRRLERLQYAQNTSCRTGCGCRRRAPAQRSKRGVDRRRNRERKREDGAAARERRARGADGG
jgi:hypothetical protein